MKSIYKDIRDIWIINIKNHYTHSLSEDLLLNTLKRHFIFYNSLGNIFYKEKNTIKYIKFSFILKDKDSIIFEFYNLKKNESICFELNEIQVTDKANLYVKFITSDYKIYHKDLSSLYYKSNKFKKRNYDHFYFKHGCVNKISIFPIISSYKIVFYIIIIITIIFIIYLEICES